MDISVTGVDRIKKHIAKYVDLSAKCAELAKRLCDIGEPIIQAAHGGHAVITVESLHNGYAITADGDERLLIIEFGAGDSAGILSQEYDEVPGVVRPGSWSISHARMYSRYGFWVFAGQIIHEVEPNPSFYYAYQRMVEYLPQIVNEVFAA